MGRPTLPLNILNKAKELKAAGRSFRYIEKKLGVGEETIRIKFS
jgi:hypothetical protein